MRYDNARRGDHAIVEVSDDSLTHAGHASVIAVESFRVCSRAQRQFKKKFTVEECSL